MSEGVDMSETVSPASAELPQQAEAQEGSLTEPKKRANSPALAPPPVAKLQRALKAELLPPPPGVVSKRNRPKPAAAAMTEQAGPSNAQSATQSSIEQGPALTAGAEPVQNAEPDPSFDELAQQAQPHEDAAPVQSKDAAQEDAAQASPELGTAEQAPALEARPTPKRQVFQSSLAPEPAQKSKGRGLWFALVGLLLLAGLTWWQLGGAN